MKHLYALLICLVFVLSSTGCNTFQFGWEREDTRKVEERADNERISGIDGPTGGHFDDEGNWIPDEATIPSTYKIPDIGAGFIIDVGSALDDDARKDVSFITPSLQVELLEFDSHIPYIRTLKLDLGVAHQRAFVYVGKLWTNIFEISTGAFVGWNWDTNEISYGIGATVIKF